MPGGGRGLPARVASMSPLSLESACKIRWSYQLAVISRHLL